MSIFKARQRSEVTAWFNPIAGHPFAVLVKHLSQREADDLWQATSDPKRDQRGQPIRVVNSQRYNEIAPDAYVTGWRDLTLDALPLLGLELEETPPTTTIDGKDVIPYTAEASRELWALAYFDRYAGPIVEFSREALVLAREARAVREKN